MTTPTEKVASTQIKPKGRPAHGRDFDCDLKILDQYKTARARDNIAYIVLGGLALFIAAAALRGLYYDDFGAVRDVWLVAGPFAGAIVGYYFHRGKENPE